MPCYSNEGEEKKKKEEKDATEVVVEVLYRPLTEVRNAAVHDPGV